MNKNLSVSRRHPIVFGIIVMIVFFAAMNAAALLLRYFGPKFLLTNGDWVMQGACECITALVAIAMAAVFKVWKMWGERGQGFGKGLLISMYFIVSGLLSVAVSVEEELSAPGKELEVPWKIVVFVATVFLIGFTEETFFRGIISNLFYDKHATDKAGVWTAVIGSGFVFGLMHLGNCLSGMVITSSGIYFEPSIVVGSIVQAAAACMMGMALTAIYYRCRSIWVLAFVHGFNNLCAAFTSGVTKGGSLIAEIGTYTPIMFVSMIPYVILILFLLRPKKMAEILEYRHSSYTPQPSQPDDELAELAAGRPEPLTYTADSAQPTDTAAYPYQKSKRSMHIAVTAAIVIMISLFAISTSLYMNSGNTFNGVFSFDSTETWDGTEAYFSRSFGSFEVDETGDYKFTITSYPGDSHAYATFNVTDSSGKVVYLDKYEGRCSLEFSLTLNEGEAYEITAYYNFSEVGEDSMTYVTRIKVE